MKYLIPGGAGNIACQFTHRLPEDAQLSSPMWLMLLSEVTPNAVYRKLDVTCEQSVLDAFVEVQPDVVLHFASLLSGQSEADRNAAWQVNMQGVFHVLESALKETSIASCF